MGPHTRQVYASTPLSRRVLAPRQSCTHSLCVVRVLLLSNHDCAGTTRPQLLRCPQLLMLIATAELPNLRAMGPRAPASLCTMIRCLPALSPYSSQLVDTSAPAFLFPPHDPMCKADFSHQEASKGRCSWWCKAEGRHRFPNPNPMNAA